MKHPYAANARTKIHLKFEILTMSAQNLSSIQTSTQIGNLSLKKSLR
jgi:hypothetical protein